MTEGMRRDGQVAEIGTETARGALDFIIAHKGAGIFQLKDFHEPLRESAEIRRRLRDVHESCVDQRKFVVISSAVRFIPEEVERSILFVELLSCHRNCTYRHHPIDRMPTLISRSGLCQ